MGLIKLIFKLLVLPLIVAVTLIQWGGIFFTQFSTVIFNLLAGLMFLITIAGWMFGISAGAETLRLLAGCLCGLYHPSHCGMADCQNRRY